MSKDSKVLFGALVLVCVLNLALSATPIRVQEWAAAISTAVLFTVMILEWRRRQQQDRITTRFEQKLQGILQSEGYSLVRLCQARVAQLPNACAGFVSIQHLAQDEESLRSTWIGLRTKLRIRPPKPTAQAVLVLRLAADKLAAFYFEPEQYPTGELSFLDNSKGCQAVTWNYAKTPLPPLE